jgi:predicted transcriptional regulator
MADINSLNWAKAPKTMLFNSDLSDRGFRVGVVLLDLISLSRAKYSKNYTWAGDKAIAAKLGISTRTAQRATRELAEMGFIKRDTYIFNGKSYRSIIVGEAPDKFVMDRIKVQAIEDLSKRSKQELEKIHKGQYIEATTVGEQANLASKVNKNKYESMKKIHGLK